MTRYFYFFLYMFLGFSIHACSGGSYLSDRLPDEIVFRKQSTGGIVDRIGGELNAPGFTLTASGKIIYYDYIGGKRTLVWARLNRRDFTQIFNRISSSWTFLRKSRPTRVSGDDILPVTEIVFLSDTSAYRGASFSDTSSAEYHASALGLWIDAYRAGKAKVFTSRSIRLYARLISHGDVSKAPEWPIREIAPDALVRVPVGFYEPNSEENGVWVSGRIAVKLQRMIPQSGIYQKYSFKGNIYAVGYRPVVP